MALDEREKQTAVWSAAGRMGIGVALVVAPGLLRWLWLGDDARRPAVKAIIRGFGARDVALGAGAYLALTADKPDDEAVSRWLTLSGASDAVDFAATVLAARHLPKRGVVLALAAAGAGAATNLRLARR